MTGWSACRWDEAMGVPEGTNPGRIGIGQWRQGINFGEFSELTIQKYYSQRPSAAVS